MRFSVAPLCAWILFAAQSAALVSTASSSPRGWNSWYNFYGASNETATLAAAEYMAQYLLPFGYDTVTIDEGWQVAEAVGANGLPVWDPNMYPSGMPALAAKIHALGLKLGLWIVRGIPRAVAEANVPIAGTNYTTGEAVRYDRNCSWDANNLGSNAPSAPASAYYASVANTMASWGVDFVKIDCMWPNKYEGTPQVYFNEDVIAETAAFRAAGLTISLSPGISVSPLNGTFLSENRMVTMYRIAEDVLDIWDSDIASGTFPQGLHQKLFKALEYESLLGGPGGAWPDWDMLQVGQVIHSYGRDVYSETHLTRDEQLTAMTLFSVTQAPLVIGGRLPLSNDENGTWTLSLLTNAEVLAMHNASAGPPHSFAPVESPRVELYGWTSTPLGQSVGVQAYVTVFNAANASETVSVRLSDVGFGSSGTNGVCLRDLWAHTPMIPTITSGSFSVTVPSHGTQAYLMTLPGDTACKTGLLL